MGVFVTCKNEEDPSKIKVLECSQLFFFQLLVYGIFTAIQGQLTLPSLVGSARIPNSSESLWFSSVPAKRKEDPIKNEGAGVFTTLNIDVSDAQGQITSY